MQKITFLGAAVSALWLVLLFLFNPHYIELTTTLETWFPAQGLIYYKDFAAYHFPLGRLILLPIHTIAGWNLRLDPFLGLAIGLGTIILLYIFCQRFISLLRISPVLASTVFFSSYFWFAANGIIYFHEILIGFLLMLTLLIFYDIFYRDNFSLMKFFTLGFLLSVTELTGQIASLTLLIIIILTITFTLKRLNSKKSLSYFFFGLTIPFLVVAVYFSANNASKEFWHYNITYYLQYAGYKKDNLLNLPFEQLAIYYLPSIILSLFWITSYLKGKKIESKYLIILILSLSSIPFTIFSIYHPHHLNYALPIQALAAGVSFEIANSFGSFGKKIIQFSVTIFLALFLTIILPWHLARVVFPPNFRIVNDLEKDDRNYSIYNMNEFFNQQVSQIILPPELAPSVHYADVEISRWYNFNKQEDPIFKTVDWIRDNTPKESKIMVMGDPIIYLRSERLPASRPSKSIPYGWEPQLIKDEIQGKRPDYWIVSSQFLNQLISNNNRQDIVDFINQELQSCFQIKIKFEDWQIWEKRCS